MKKILAAIVVVLVGLLTACGPVSSLNPLFTSQDVVFDPGLLGDWTQDGPDNFTLRFEKDGSNGYRVIDTEFDGDGSPKQTEYRAHLVDLNGHRFLDVLPAQVAAQSASYQMSLASTEQVPRDSRQAGSAKGSQLLRLGDGFYAEVTPGPSATASAANLNLRQAHWIFKVQSDGGTLSLASLDEDWLQKAIDQGQVSVASAVTSDASQDLVLTADTQELQRFVIEHADDDETFPQTTQLYHSH
jgi:hypothetical protein